MCTWLRKHNKVMSVIFENHAGARLKGWLERIRRKENVKEWLLKEMYYDMHVIWDSPEYKALSEKNKQARASLKGGSLHTGGAKSVGTIIREMVSNNLKF